MCWNHIGLHFNPETIRFGLQKMMKDAQIYHQELDEYVIQAQNHSRLMQ